MIAQVREKDRNGGQEWNLTAKCPAIIPETIVFPDSRSYGWFADRSAEVEAFFALQPVDALEAYVDVPRRAELVAFATTANILERVRPLPLLLSLVHHCSASILHHLYRLLSLTRSVTISFDSLDTLSKLISNPNVVVTSL